ncbi:Homeodomain-like protein, partial [Suillus paluster]|uniref:Homeodomain-like protein n=1 Tax=Suillus paluster TaxID=48578 RepID=UPI001B861EDB
LYAMVNRRISEDIKQCALRLWNHGWDVQDICEALGISQSSCYRWRRIFEELGTVKKPPSPLIGRTRIITRALLTAVEDLFAEDSDLFLDEVCTWLAGQHNIIIGTSMLCHNLKQAGLT